MSMKTLPQRVLARYLSAATRKMKPEKLIELMMKLRKGAGSSVKMEIVWQVFEELGGWSYEDGFTYDPFNFGKPSLRAYDTEEQAEAAWKEAKAKEVSSLPPSKTLTRSDMDREFITDLTRVNALGGGKIGFSYQSWRVTFGILIKSPRGHIFATRGNTHSFLSSYPSNFYSYEEKLKFPDWLKKEGFYDQINEKLGLESIEVEKAKSKKTAPRTTDNTGTCPCCFGNFKLVPRTKEGKDKSMPGMVLHGYERPGIGYIDGNCPGMNWPPFELSPEGTQHALLRAESWLKAAKESLDRWSNPDNITEIHEIERSLIPGRQLSTKVYKKEETNPHDWDRLYRRQLADVKLNWDKADTQVKFLERKIASWTLQPLP